MAETVIENISYRRTANGMGYRAERLPKDINCSVCKKEMQMPVYICSKDKRVYCEACEKDSAINWCVWTNIEHEHIMISEVEWREA